MMLALVLKRSCLVIFGIFAITAVNVVYAELIYSEIADAGLTALAAQALPAGTTQITGSLHPDDGADVYEFAWEGGDFSAATQGDFDTMLSVFNSAGGLLAFNDDFVENGKISFVSLDHLSKGDYLLGITYYDNNYNGDIDGYSNFGIDGAYQIELSSSELQTVGEPSSIALVCIALMGLVYIRRKRI